jgi:chemotaxis protein CheD
MKLARREGVIVTYALGSCVGITFYDPVIKLASMVHIMLPNVRDLQDTQLYKYADTGIRETLRRMKVFGGVKERYICHIAGGAMMFQMRPDSAITNIGQRNIESVRNILREEQIKIAGQDVGSNYARTMLIDVDTGQVTIRTVGKKDVLL